MDQIKANPGLLRQALHYAEFARGLIAARRHPVAADPEAAILEQLRRREERFLDLLRRVVFDRPAHPLHRMMREARCLYGDIEHGIAAKGLEPTLELLRGEGVFISADEFKGRKAIVRGGRHIPAKTSDFVNPLSRPAWHKETSGTTGTPTRLPKSVAASAQHEYYRAVSLRQFGVGGRRWFSLAPILPSTHGITQQIWNQKMGLRVHRWFAAPGNRPESRYHRAVTRMFLAELHLLGVRAPPLTFLPQNDFLPVAREIASARALGVASFVNGSASSCVRVAAAALEKGLDISGTRFLAGSEGLSPAKAASIHRAGAESFAMFWASEVGPAGFGCPHYEGQNTVHHFRDATAIVRAPVIPQGSESEVQSLFFTTLLPSAPLFLVNYELGDQGEIEPATCNCRFSQLGFNTVISGIRSYTKMKAYGVTHATADVVRIVEELLPARFGGCAADYQLAEQEKDARTVVVLRVNPRLGAFRAGEVETFFLDEVRKLFGGSLTVRTWTHAGGFQVVAEAPLAGATGKIMPVHLQGRGAVRSTPEVVHAP